MMDFQNFKIAAPYFKGVLQRGLEMAHPWKYSLHFFWVQKDGERWRIEIAWKTQWNNKKQLLQTTTIQQYHLHQTQPKKKRFTIYI